MAHNVARLERRAMRRREHEAGVWPALAQEGTFCELALALHDPDPSQTPSSTDPVDVRSAELCDTVVAASTYSYLETAPRTREVGVAVLTGVFLLAPTLVRDVIRHGSDLRVL
jgi:hypothetical protein